MNLSFEKIDDGVMVIAIYGAQIQPLDVTTILNIDSVDRYFIQAIRSYQPIDIRRYGTEPQQRYAVVGTKIVVYYDERSDLASVPVIGAQTLRIVAASCGQQVVATVRRSRLACVEQGPQQRYQFAVMQQLVERIGVPPPVQLADVTVRDRYATLHCTLAAMAS